MTTSRMLLKRHRSQVPTQYDKDNEFRLEYNERSYHNQFFKLYLKRLDDLRPRVFESANTKWDHKKINGVQVCHRNKVLDIKNNEPCWVIGLTYCEIQYKPNVLDDVAVGAYGPPPATKPSYSDPDSDLLMLEDESGRVQLDGDLIKSSIFVTGNVIGVLGIEIDAGLFKVLDVIYPSVAPQVPRALREPSLNGSNKVAIVSGLEIDPDNYDVVRLEILKEFLLGEIGEDSRTLASRISRLVIAGNSTNTVTLTHENDETKYYGSRSTTRYNSKAMSLLDSLIEELLSSISIDLLPGETDPAEAIIPQQPIHSAFFKKSKKYLTPNNESINFRSLTNPAWIEIDGVRMLGTTGQNVNDMFKYLVPYYRLEASTKVEEPKPEENLDKLRADIVEATIQWQNIIPSCPDTLWTYPFQDRDPFTLTETPHVYFVSNQPQFTTKMLNLEDGGRSVSVRLISVPKFSNTGEIVLLDTDTLETEVLKIC